MTGATLAKPGERSVAAPESCAPLRKAESTFPYEGKGDRSAVDEVSDSPERPAFAVTPTLERALVLPLEGKGDRVSGG